MEPIAGQSCERARQWASLRLDGELSELESRLLAEHVRRCAACAAHVDEVEWAAAALRATPLEPFRVELVLPLRRRLAARPVGVAAAVGVAALAALATGIGILEEGDRSGDRPAVAHVSNRPAIDDAKEMTEVKRARLIAQTPHLWMSSPGRRLT